MIASSLSDFLADASPALHLGAAFIAPLLPDCRVAFPPFLSRKPICLVSAGLPGNGHERFGALDWGGGGRGGERGGAGGGGAGSGGGERDAERETARQTAKQMAARGGGVQAERGETPSVGGAREPINSRCSCGARKQV